MLTTLQQQWDRAKASPTNPRHVKSEHMCVHCLGRNLSAKSTCRTCSTSTVSPLCLGIGPRLRPPSPWSPGSRPRKSPKLLQPAKVVPQDAPMAEVPKSSPATNPCTTYQHNKSNKRSPRWNATFWTFPGMATDVYLDALEEIWHKPGQNCLHASLRAKPWIKWLHVAGGLRFEVFNCSLRGASSKGGKARRSTKISVKTFHEARTFVNARV